MSRDEDILKTYYDGITQRFRIEIDLLNKLIGHRGEIGRANENSLINLLTKFLPRKYSFGSGIIIDKDGNRSRQIDIIIYDSYFHPELFSQVATSLYPVDVVYMAIEVKTTANKQIMKEAIENIASVKRLEYIRSPIYEIKGNSVTISKTSPPLGVIFVFNTMTKDFNIFESWITSREVPENERSDLSYILNSTFFYGFLDLDHKDEFTKGIYLHQESVNIINNKIENVENFKRLRDDLRYPLVKFEGTERIVDQALGFVNFLSNIYDMLALKRIVESSILREYLTNKMLYEARQGRYR